MSSLQRCLVGVAVVLLVPFAARLPAEETAFPLKDGDVWVMVGDSITAQHLHSNYFEAFCYARFPKLKFCFRNSGVGGDTIPRVLARFDWDVACWKPTVVSVELGMNDAGQFKTEQYMANMVTLVDRIRKTGARPVLFAPSPVNIGGRDPRWVAWNKTLASFSKALADYAARENIRYANQFDALHPWWERNTADVHAAELITQYAARSDWPGHEHLAAWLKAWQADKSPKPVLLQGDPVHPGPPGQLTMAAELLIGLNAPGLVSTAAIDASAGKMTEARQCRIENLKVANDRISFSRWDECLPLPIPADARVVLDVMPRIADLSQFTLTVSGTKAKAYDVSIDDQKVARVPADRLAAGWNMGLLDKGPLAQQCDKVLDLVAAKEKIVSEHRAFARAVADKKAQPDPHRLADLAKKAEQADAAIREAAQPRPHTYVLEAVNQDTTDNP